MNQDPNEDKRPDSESDLPTVRMEGEVSAVGEPIGPYKLLSVLGEGGCGMVYLAEQEQPVRRRVALKVIKPGMDTKQVIARFEAERQALALLDHVNIAHVFDAGTTGAGRPYFVMEYVKGKPILAFCDREKRTIEERLTLFLSVCEAIQHAHHKGIIHRDIKPSNILITLQEGRAVPKVIDFGVAKAMVQPLTERTLYTEQGQFLGTPEYMSPEQADRDSEDVDTRSDVYSLGVVLYELLTGVLPFDSETLRAGGIEQIRRKIREEDPRTPSTRLQTLSRDTVVETAQGRQTDLRTLARQLHGDLDWIVIKAMDKDPERRYQSPQALADDIQRHLRSEAVLAGAPSTLYRLKKFARRNRARIWAAEAILVILLCLGFSYSLWRRNMHEQRVTDTLLDMTELSKAREAYTRHDLETTLQRVKRLLDSPYVGAEARLLFAGVLMDGGHSAQATEQLEGLLNEKPKIAGTAHALLGRLYWESDLEGADKLDKVHLHREKAETLLPDTAEAYLLRAMAALTVKETLAFLDKALNLEPGHYEARRQRAYTHFAAGRWRDMEDDAYVMTVSRPQERLGYILRGQARLEQDRLTGALSDFERALELTEPNDAQVQVLRGHRCATLLRMERYQDVLRETRALIPMETGMTFRFYRFSAFTQLGRYEQARALFQDLQDNAASQTGAFVSRVMKHVSNQLVAGKTWHAPGDPPKGLPYMWMLEAAEHTRDFMSKGWRLATSGFHTEWSPDGKKVAFSLGVHGYSGLAVYDINTRETEVLMVPGKDPEWSPDGQTIAFVRDCKVLPVSDLVTADLRNQHRSYQQEEVWIIRADGSEPRRLDWGGWPSWGKESRFLYYCSRLENTLFKIDVTDPNAKREKLFRTPKMIASVSPDDRYLAYTQSFELRIQAMEPNAPTLHRWQCPAHTWGGNWLPSGRAFCMGGPNNRESFTGLWVYDLESQEARRFLSGQVVSADWSPDETHLTFALGPPFYEVWLAERAKLGPGLDTQQYYDEIIRLLQGRIEHDPGNQHYRVTLNNTRYVAGYYTDAFVSLENWESHSLTAGREVDPRCLLLQVLSLAQLDRKDEARAKMATLRQRCYQSANLDQGVLFAMCTAEQLLIEADDPYYEVWDLLKNRKSLQASQRLSTIAASVDPNDTPAQATLRHVQITAAFGMTVLHMAAKQWQEGIEVLERIVARYPDVPAALNVLAHILAVVPSEEHRDGEKAVRYAQRACDLVGNNDAYFMDTLAIAHAAAGDFKKAVDIQIEALQLCRDKPAQYWDRQTITQMSQRLELFKDGKPYREER